MRKSLYAALASTLLVGCAVTEPVYADHDFPVHAHVSYDVHVSSPEPKVEVRHYDDRYDYEVSRHEPRVEKRHYRKRPSATAHKHYRKPESRRW